MQTATLIQARMGSTRLPGKVLMDLGGVTMLERVVRRAERSRQATRTAVITSSEAADDAIVSLCDVKGFACFRGSELDVLDRYYQAAIEFEADVVVRITADCPFTDPQVIDQVIGAYDEAAVDYASNTLKRTFPHGLDIEVFSFAALSEAAHMAKGEHERTHVTPYIYQRPNRFRLRNLAAPSDYSHYRWTVDEMDDLVFARELYQAMGNLDAFGWQDAVSYLRINPALTTINQVVRQKGLYEG